MCVCVVRACVSARVGLPYGLGDNGNNKTHTHPARRQSFGGVRRSSSSVRRASMINPTISPRPQTFMQQVSGDGGGGDGAVAMVVVPLVALRSCSVMGCVGAKGVRGSS